MLFYSITCPSGVILRANCCEFDTLRDRFGPTDVRPTDALPGWGAWVMWRLGAGSAALTHLGFRRHMPFCHWQLKCAIDLVVFAKTSINRASFPTDWLLTVVN